MQMNRDLNSGMDGSYKNEMSFDGGCCNNTCEPAMPGMVCPPVMECPRETVCHRYICHEVPHIEPCHTRIVNHHIYRHTFTPQYTCCEQNEIQNVYDRRCC